MSLSPVIPYAVLPRFSDGSGWLEQPWNPTDWVIIGWLWDLREAETEQYNADMVRFPGASENSLFVLSSSLKLLDSNKGLSTLIHLALYGIYDKGKQVVIVFSEPD